LVRIWGDGRIDSTSAWDFPLDIWCESLSTSRRQIVYYNFSCGYLVVQCRLHSRGLCQPEDTRSMCKQLAKIALR
jgi:hypothetical protein